MIRWISNVAMLSLALIFCLSPVRAEEESPRLRTLEGRQLKADLPAGQRVQTPPRESVQFAEAFLPKTLDKQKIAEIKSKIDAILKEKSMRSLNVGIYIADLETGQIIYERQGRKALKPASNMKLLTTAAALGILGPDHQFLSQVFADGTITKAGTLKGDLHLNIDHDFTWSTRFYDSQDEVLRQLAVQVREAGIKKIEGKIILSGRVVMGGKATGVLNCNQHLRTASNRWIAQLKSQSITGGKLSIQSQAKRKGKVVGQWKSPTLSEALVPINRSSHNEYADLLLMALGEKAEGKSSFEAGSRAVFAWLKEEGISTSGLVIKDGSGLSHDNRMSAEFLNALSAHMLKSKFAAPWAASLSIAGYDGTYGGRLKSESTIGRVLVKSGTLRDVISGSGFLVNSHDGRIYTFSLLANEMRAKKATRLALDRIVQVCAQNLHQMERLKPVQMRSLMEEDKGGVVVARWEKLKGAEGYRIWKSKDGQNGWTSEALPTRSNFYYFEKSADPLFVRVTAYDAKGGESDPSAVFAYKDGSQKVSFVEAAPCQWDERTRPKNRFFSHDMALATAIPENYGALTVSPSAIIPENDLIFWHGGVCENVCDLQSKTLLKAWSGSSPMIVDYFDAHMDSNVQGSCEPDKGALRACFREPLISMDRRLEGCGDNHRIRKAAGTGTTRPTIVSTWGAAKPCLKVKGNSLAVCHEEKKRAIVGIDLGAFDTVETQREAFSQILKGIGL